MTDLRIIQQIQTTFVSKSKQTWKSLVNEMTQKLPPDQTKRIIKFCASPEDVKSYSNGKITFK